MKIIIPGVEERTVNFYSTKTEGYVRYTLEYGGEVKIHYLSHTNGICIEEIPKEQRPKSYKQFSNAGASQLLQAIHQCFNRHLPLLLTPNQIWCVMCHEAKTTIAHHAEKYAEKCTTKPGEKIVLQVQDDSLDINGQCNWAANIPRFKSLLESHVPAETMGIFFPEFTTTTEEEAIANLINFMGAVSPYYSFRELTSCGIPEIKLSGTQEDWQLLVKHANLLAGFLPELSEYFDVLLPILEKIAQSWGDETVDHKFWKSIYHYNSESGHDWVSGWINTLFAYELRAKDWQSYRRGKKDFILKESFANWMRGPKQHEGGGVSYEGGCDAQYFPSLVVRVPFVWDYQVGDNSREIPMAFIAGPLSMRFVDDRYLTSQLGFGVVELLENRNG